MPIRKVDNADRVQDDLMSGKSSEQRAADRQSPEVIGVDKNHHDIEIESAGSLMKGDARRPPDNAILSIVNDSIERQLPSNAVL